MMAGDDELGLIRMMAMTMAARYRVSINEAQWRNVYPDREPVSGFAALEDFCRHVAVKLAGWSEDRFDAEVDDHVTQGFAIRFVVNSEAMLIVTVPLRDPIEDRRSAKKCFRRFMQNGQRELAKLAR